MADPIFNAVPDVSVASDPAGNVHDLGRVIETGAQRLRRLQMESYTLAAEQVEALARDFSAVAARAEEIAAGGDIYPAGVRDICARIADDLSKKVLSMMSIMDRTRALRT